MKTNNEALCSFALETETTIPDGRWHGIYCADTLTFTAAGTAYELATPVRIRGRVEVVVVIERGRVDVLEVVEGEVEVPPAIAAFILGAAPGATSAQWSTLYAELEALIDGLGQGIEAALHLMRRQTSDIAHRRNMDARTVESFVSVMLNRTR